MVNEQLSFFFANFSKYLFNFFKILKANGCTEQYFYLYVNDYLAKI